MQITISKDQLSKTIKRCLGAIAEKSTMPILTTIKLTASEGKLQYHATDLYLAVSGSVECEVTRPGSAAIPAKEFAERVNAMPNGPLTITYVEGRATIKGAGARKYTLQCLDAKDYPAIADVPTGAVSLTFPARTLASILSRVRYAISTDQARAHLNSALVEWEGETLRAVATNGHLLAKCEATLAGRAGSLRMLVALPAVIELVKALDVDGDVTLIQDGAWAHFKLWPTTVTTKLVDATFPPYQQVIPPARETSFTVNRATFADAIKATAVAADAKTNGLRLTVGDGLVRLSAEGATSGNGEDEVACEATGSIRFGAAANYLAESLSAAGGESVAVDFGDSLDPIRFTGTNGFTGILMVMRL